MPAVCRAFRETYMTEALWSPSLPQSRHTGKISPETKTSVTMETDLLSISLSPEEDEDERCAR